MPDSEYWLKGSPAAPACNPLSINNIPYLLFPRSFCLSIFLYMAYHWNTTFDTFWAFSQPQPSHHLLCMRNNNVRWAISSVVILDWEGPKICQFQWHIQRSQWPRVMNELFDFLAFWFILLACQIKHLDPITHRILVI